MIKGPTREVSSMSCEDLFRSIRERQIVALMFHDQSADLFDFLGLKGFKRMHEFQYLAESLEHRRLSRYYINHHNKLLFEGPLDNPQVVPMDWSKYTRFEVTIPVRKQSVERSFEDYYGWEYETREFLCQCSKRLLELGRIADFDMVNSLLLDVDMELKYLSRMIITLKSISYDPIQVEAMQQELHEHYKNRLEELELF